MKYEKNQASKKAYSRKVNAFSSGFFIHPDPAVLFTFASITIHSKKKRNEREPLLRIFIYDTVKIHVEKVGYPRLLL
jgi:hypothetical protein